MSSTCTSWEKREILEVDKEFLLRCSLTYNWDTLIDFCDFLLEILTGAVHNLNGYQRNLVMAAKDQLTRRDEWGNTALHAACYNNPPLPVVTSILNCTNAANLREYHLILTRDNSTPLNIACATGASTDVIRVLLNPPSRMNDGGIAVCIPDSQGSTPLVELTINYELQRKSPVYNRSALPLEQVYSVDDSIIEPLLKSYWIKVEMLIRSAWFVLRSRFGACASLLHAAAALCEHCPTSLTCLICRSFQAKADLTSQEGFLPLHLALLTSSGKYGTKQNGLRFAHRRTMWIQTLANLYPAGVRAVIPKTGRSIFCQAIAAGLHWHHIGDQFQRDSAEDQIGPLQFLWKHDNDALSSPDLITGLPPFLLAATVTGEDQVSQLDTIFCLLRSHPQLLDNIFDTKERQEHRFNLLIAQTLSASFGPHC